VDRLCSTSLIKCPPTVVYCGDVLIMLFQCDSNTGGDIKPPLVTSRDSRHPLERWPLVQLEDDG
jgi:hypothetical protein